MVKREEKSNGGDKSWKFVSILAGVLLALSNALLAGLSSFVVSHNSSIAVLEAEVKKGEYQHKEHSVKIHELEVEVDLLERELRDHELECLKNRRRE